MILISDVKILTPKEVLLISLILFCRFFTVYFKILELAIPWINISSTQNLGRINSSCLCKRFLNSLLNDTEIIAFRFIQVSLQWRKDFLCLKH